MIKPGNMIGMIIEIILMHERLSFDNGCILNLAFFVFLAEKMVITILWL